MKESEAVIDSVFIGLLVPFYEECCKHLTKITEEIVSGTISIGKQKPCYAAQFMNVTVLIAVHITTPIVISKPPFCDTLLQVQQRLFQNLYKAISIDNVTLQIN